MTAAPTLPSTADLAPPDLPPPRRRFSLRAVVSFLALACFGGIVGALGARMLGDAPPWQLAPLLLSLFAALWLQLVLHEGGHALAGIARGMRPIAFGLGPWRIERGQAGRWRTRWGGGIRGIGGFAALVPPPDRAMSALDEALYLLGGPLANLLSAAAGFGWLALHPEASGLAAGMLWMFAGSSLLLGVVNLVPFHSQGWRSDGRGLLDVLRGAPAATHMRRISQLAALSMVGVRPRDWPEALLPERPDAQTPPALARTLHLLRLSHALDRGAEAEARSSARALREGYADAPDGVRQTVALLLASHAALVERDHALLAAWRPRVEGGLLDLGAQRAWLDAELALLGGDRATARDAISRARLALPRVHDSGSAVVLTERLASLAAAAHAA